MKYFLILTLITCLNSLAQNDTISIETFANGIPPDWAIHDSTNNNYNWLHRTTGMNSAWNNEPATGLSSSSASDGWIMMNADFYNTDTTGGGLVGIWPGTQVNASINSPSYDFSTETDVILSFEHWYYTLSGCQINLEIGVSTDSINWSIIDGRTGGCTEFPATGFIYHLENAHFDISSIAAGQSNVYIRFHMHSGTHHFWSIDDMAFLRSIPSTADLITVNSDIITVSNPIIKGDPIIVNGIQSSVDFKIVSAMGETIETGVLDQNQNSIILKNISAGNYFISIKNETHPVIILE